MKTVMVVSYVDMWKAELVRRIFGSLKPKWKWNDKIVNFSWSLGGFCVIICKISHSAIALVPVHIFLQRKNGKLFLSCEAIFESKLDLRSGFLLFLQRSLSSGWVIGVAPGPPIHPLPPPLHLFYSRCQKILPLWCPLPIFVSGSRNLCFWCLPIFVSGAHVPLSGAFQPLLVTVIPSYTWSWSYTSRFSILKILADQAILLCL